VSKIEIFSARYCLRGKPRTPRRGTARSQNTAKSPGFSERPLRDAQAWRAGRYAQPLAMRRRTNVDVLLRVVCGPCRGERWTSKCRSTCRFKRSSDEHGKDHHEAPTLPGRDHFCAPSTREHVCPLEAPLTVGAHALGHDRRLTGFEETTFGAISTCVTASFQRCHARVVLLPCVVAISCRVLCLAVWPVCGRW